MPRPNSKGEELTDAWIACSRAIPVLGNNGPSSSTYIHTQELQADSRDTTWHTLASLKSPTLMRGAEVELPGPSRAVLLGQV